VRCTIMTIAATGATGATGFAVAGPALAVTPPAAAVLEVSEGDLGAAVRSGTPSTASSTPTGSPATTGPTT
jgi:hypothetical protein